MDTDSAILLLLGVIPAIFLGGYAITANNKRKEQEKVEARFIDFAIKNAERDKIPTFPKEAMRKYLHVHRKELIESFEGVISRKPSFETFPELIEKIVSEYR